jgi:hypothetical protein
MASPQDNFIWCPETIPPRRLPYDDNSGIPMIRSATEIFKMQRQLLSSTPLERFELDFGEILASGVTICRNNIKAHYEAQIEDYYDFYWTGVPSYLSITSIHVRYEPGSYEESPVAKSNGLLWSVKMIFRKEV